MKTLKLLLVALTITLGWVESQAQTADSTIMWRVVTFDENEYIGILLKRDTETVQLQTERLGILTIQVRDIRKMEQINPNQMVEGEIWAENQAATRYFWITNGYNLKQGEGYYQNVWIFFNQASFGITDHFSMSVGTIPLFLFAGQPTPVWVVPKVSFPVVKDKFNIGAGMLVGTIIGLEEGFAGVAFGSATYGSRDRNVNFGIGYGFVEGEWSNRPVLSLSAMHRYSKRGYILTENYYFDFGDTSAGIISFGGRTVWDNITLDYGGFLPVGDIGEVIIIPWLGLIIPFGGK